MLWSDVRLSDNSITPVEGGGVRNAPQQGSVVEPHHGVISLDHQGQLVVYLFGIDFLKNVNIVPS